ncbi:unnamed protein product [Pleuronectes platessa]|uniref:Uncharacterized protein n=1 Tax=Pleuronectes platessa TaxID=8262 RepID=A0A9N7VUF7_PLEPL|nr:unnamed protein product [Pleuronectes platessa]
MDITGPSRSCTGQPCASDMWSGWEWNETGAAGTSEMGSERRENRECVGGWRRVEEGGSGEQRGEHLLPAGSPFPLVISSGETTKTQMRWKTPFSQSLWSKRQTARPPRPQQTPIYRDSIFGIVNTAVRSLSRC